MPHILNLGEAVALGFHAMVLLAQQPRRRFPSSEIARVFSASEHTLAPVMKRLVRAGLADAVRGARGGFRLAADPGKVSLLELYELLAGPLEVDGCLLSSPECVGARCAMKGLVARLSREAREWLRRETLADLAGTVRLRREPGRVAGSSGKGVGNGPRLRRR